MKQKRSAKKFSKPHLWLVPTKHNAHRPHLVRRRSLIVITLFLIGLQFSYNFLVIGKPKILGYATNVSAQTLTADINHSRTAKGIAALTVNAQLNKAASLKANDMLKEGYWSHTAPNGTQPWRWFEEAGYNYQRAGENLAKDFKTSEGVVSAWLDSETHRRNMLNSSFENIGVAVVNGKLDNKETTLVVALFGTKKSAVSAIPEEGITTSTTTSYNSNIFANPAQVTALMNPVSISTLLVLLCVAGVALLTHWRYIKLPRKMRKSWYRHHAFYTAGMALLAITYITYIFTAGAI